MPGQKRSSAAQESGKGKNAEKGFLSSASNVLSSQKKVGSGYICWLPDITVKNLICTNPAVCIQHSDLVLEFMALCIS